MHKTIAIILLLLSSATNYFMYNYGVYIDATMIRNTFETNQREALDLLTFKLFVWITITGIIPAIILIFTKIKYKKFLSELKLRLIFSGIGILIILIFTGISFKEYAAFGRNNRDVRKLINTINYNYATIRYFRLQYLAHRKFIILDKNPQIIPYDDKSRTLLVLVIGETARAKNFSLNNYDRETNPLLKKEDIVNFKNVSSCGTATAISVPCIFSNMNREEFDVVDAKYIENLLDIVKSAGYDVIWLDNDDGCKGVCNRVYTEEMVKINNKKYCDGEYCMDDVLLDGLDDRIKNIKKDTLLVIHTMGSHGPTYYKRYPESFKKFTPSCDTAELQNCEKQQIVNAYDNTILYTDYILSSIIKSLKKFPELESSMLYVSDHGESLGENNIYLHSMPYKIAPEEQTHVPMVMWMSETMKKEDFIDYSCLKQEATNDSFSHDNIFHSVIGLLEIKSSTYKKEYDMFLKCRTKKLPYQI